MALSRVEICHGGVVWVWGDLWGVKQVGYEEEEGDGCVMLTVMLMVRREGVAGRK